MYISGQSYTSNSSNITSALEKLNNGTVTNLSSNNIYKSDQISLTNPNMLSGNVANANPFSSPVPVYSDPNLNSIFETLRSGTSLIQPFYNMTLDFQWPTDSTKITSDFGYRNHPIYGDTRHHDGIDIGAASGTPIYASASGVVIRSGVNGGYGNSITIDHGNGISTLYGHASKLYVKEGTYVNKGDVIAAVGSTGVSTGPHLHFEVRKDGEQVDPMDYFS